MFVLTKRMIDIVKDNYDKNNTYKVINAKYTQALKEGYYLEALMITYALVEDRLRSFLYFIGLIETNENNQLYLCEKNKQIIDIIKIKSKKPDKYKFDDISSKYKAVNNIVKWVNTEKKLKSKKSYLYTLNYECESLDIAGITSEISKMRNWLKYRNEVTHGLLNKNIDSLNKEIENRAREGKQYFDFISSQVKILKRENNIRKFLDL